MALLKKSSTRHDFLFVFVVNHSKADN